MAPYVFANRGLLLRAEKRFSRGFQFLGSYAYSHNTATLPGNGFNLDNWLENRGPSGLSHILNLAGALELPSQFELGLNFSFSSASPFSAFVGGIDFNGDGTTERPAAGHNRQRVQRQYGTRGPGTPRRRLQPNLRRDAGCPGHDDSTRDASAELLLWRQSSRTGYSIEPVIYGARAPEGVPHRRSVQRLQRREPHRSQ